MPKALADASKVRDSVSAWKVETEQAASLARAQAESRLAQAKQKHDAAQSALDDANKRAAEIDAKMEAARQAFPRGAGRSLG